MCMTGWPGGRPALAALGDFKAIMAGQYMRGQSVTRNASHTALPAACADVLRGIEPLNPRTDQDAGGL
jgi:hypothetical protein